MHIERNCQMIARKKRWSQHGKKKTSPSTSMKRPKGNLLKGAREGLRDKRSPTIKTQVGDFSKSMGKQGKDYKNHTHFEWQSQTVSTGGVENAL